MGFKHDDVNKSLINGYGLNGRSLPKGSGLNMKEWSLTFSVLIMTALLLSLIPGTASSEGSDDVLSRTRSGPQVRVELDGQVVARDICLAGLNSGYWIHYNFTGVDYNSIEGIIISMVKGSQGVDEELFTFDLLSNPITVENEIPSQAEAFSPTVKRDDDYNFTLSFKIRFHLSWTGPTEFRLEPELVFSASTLVPEIVEDITVEVWGRLKKPRDVIIFNHLEEEVLPGGVVRADQAIEFRSIRFYYDHPEFDFSSVSPYHSEISARIVNETDHWELQWQDDGFAAEAVTPDIESGQARFGIAVLDIRENWLVLLREWSVSVYIDGLGPSVTVNYPQEDVKEEDTTVDWSVRIVDRPLDHPSAVNGTSIAVRVWKEDGGWGEWTQTKTYGYETTINAYGAVECSVGIGTSRLQFKAADVLGNEVLTDEYPVHVNVPPVVTVPDEYTGISAFNNGSLVLDGSLFTVDVDDTDLIYTWYFDGDLISSGKNSTFTKALFSVPPGEYMMSLVVSDHHSEDNASFRVKVLDAPDENTDEDFDLIELLFTPPGIYITGLVGLVILLVVIIVVVLMISRKVRHSHRTDFVIDEEAAADNTKAAEVARKLHDMYSTQTAYESEGYAQVDEDSDEFDFDYNLYEVLGLEGSADEKEVKKAYRRFAAFYHPDRVAVHKEADKAEAGEMMVQINKAKEILLDPEKKYRYDNFIKDSDFSIEL